MTLLQSNIGGSGAYARGLLNALSRRNDVEVRVIHASTRGGVGTVSWMLSGARNTVRQQEADLLHCPGFLVPLTARRPMVITIHDLSLGLMPQGHPFEWRLYYRALFPRLARRATVVIVPTEATRQDVIRSLEVPSHRVVVTPYGVDPQFFDTPKTGRDPARPQILFSGPPIKRKNLDAVLRVLAFAPPQNVLGRARLKITGARSAEFTQYRQWISANGLADRVDWLGAVPFSDLPALYAAADVLAYPSFIEGFGFPPLEAMAAGTPVVASNASCIPEVLGNAALLVDPNDDRGLSTALEAVISDSSLRERLIRTASSWVQRYTWAKCAEMTVSAYRAAALAT